MSLIAFVQDRVARQRMDGVALARANRLMRAYDAEGRILLCAPRPGAVAVPAANARMAVAPISFRDACAMVNMYHRHLAGPVGHLFSVGCFADGILVGAAIASRPVSRHLDDGRTVEVVRVATNGHRNACSMLLGAVRREAGARGATDVITYTLPGETGASLRAAGFEEDGTTAGGYWSRRGRRRADRQPLCVKTRWRCSTHPRRGK